MTTTTVQKGAVISISVPEDANIIVLHKDGTVNADCISVARLSDEKHYHYILQNEDVVVKEVTRDKASQRHITMERVIIQVAGDRVRASFVDAQDVAQFTQFALRVLDTHPHRSLNYLSSLALTYVHKFANLLTHGIMTNIQGHAIDFLVDAPGILFEKLGKNETPDYRPNTVQSIATIQGGEIIHSDFISVGSGLGSSYSGSEHSLLITRSLRHAMRLTVSTHSQDDLEAAQLWFEKLITSTGHQIRKTKTKRGDLFIVLPQLSKAAIELCKLVG